MIYYFNENFDSLYKLELYGHFFESNINYNKIYILILL